MSRAEALRPLRVALVIRAAKESARVHQEDFPGEALSGDWDAEAYAIDRAGWDSSGLAGWDDAWTLYRDTLHAEVERLRKGGAR